MGVCVMALKSALSPLFLCVLSVKEGSDYEFQIGRCKTHY